MRDTTPRLPDAPHRPIEREEHEPATDIETLGAMLEDHQVVGLLLRQLPFERTHYRSNLRIILGKAVRMRDRCRRLLDEADAIVKAKLADVMDRPEIEEILAEGLGRAAGETLEQIQHNERALDPSIPVDTAADPSNIIDASADEGILPHRRNGNGPKHPPPRPATPDAPPTEKKSRKRSTAVPIEGGIKAAILAALEREGPMTSTELAESIRTKSGVTPGAVYDCLAKLRTGKDIITERAGAGMINRLP